MKKKLTLSISEDIYNGLYDVIGKRNISYFIENLVRPHVINPHLLSSYEEMAQDIVREQEATEWIEGMAEEFTDEAW